MGDTHMTKLGFFTALALLASASAHAATINVTYSEDFAEDLADDYGVREGDVLTEEIIEDIDAALLREGVDVARIEVTIIDAKPNRPTFEQLGARPGLDYSRSFSLGGMKLSAIVFDTDGNEVTTVEYDWYEHDLQQASYGTTWSDARRASSRFSRRLADAIVGE